MEESQQLEDSNHQERWNPFDFLERIFSQIGRNNDNRQRHHGDDVKDRKQYASSVPIVTLFFDRDKNLSVAVLSRQIECLDVYFQCRVAQGTAFQRSPLYYELEGYVRENRAKIRRQGGFNPESIAAALGAMKSSDEAQKAQLMEDRFRYLQERHGVALEIHPDNQTLETVLEIARLHRLGNDLDVMSIYCMRLTSKTFGKVAARIARDRMRNTTLKLKPLVDGVLEPSYSKFVRRCNSNLIRKTESGSKVVYHKCNDIKLQATNTHGSFVPYAYSGTSQFSWKCEEIAYANLHRWWGDIVVRDYVGHKLVLTWELQADSADWACFDDCSVPLAVPLETVRIEADPGTGRRTWPAMFASITMNVEKSSSTCIEHVTTVYQGRSVVERVDVNFFCLVRASARAILDRTRRSRSLYELERPLLDHETDYLQLVAEAAEK